MKCCTVCGHLLCFLCGWAIHSALFLEFSRVCGHTEGLCTSGFLRYIFSSAENQGMCCFHPLEVCSTWWSVQHSHLIARLATLPHGFQFPHTCPYFPTCMMFSKAYLLLLSPRQLPAWCLPGCLHGDLASVPKNYWQNMAAHSNSVPIFECLHANLPSNRAD